MCSYFFQRSSNLHNYSYKNNLEGNRNNTLVITSLKTNHKLHLCKDALLAFVLLAIDGNYTEWSEWSDCSATCGGGSQVRSRKCTNPPPQHGGKNCDDLGPAEQTQKCNPDPCCEFKFNWFKYNQFIFMFFKHILILFFFTPDRVAIDGNYTEWTEWTDCSATCGGGFQARSRKCTNPPPQNGGKNCVELGPANQTHECNTDPCRKFILV